jgi:hypothetical protein
MGEVAAAGTIFGGIEDCLLSSPEYAGCDDPGRHDLS